MLIISKAIENDLNVIFIFMFITNFLCTILDKFYIKIWKALDKPSILINLRSLTKRIIT